MEEGQTEQSPPEVTPNKPTSHHYLLKVLYETKTNISVLPGLDPQNQANYFRFPDGLSCDEVYPDIFISNVYTARHKDYLKRLKITHILNAAEVKQIGFVSTGKHYYGDMIEKYLGLPLDDMPDTDISQYFPLVASFIEDAINSNGRIIVHCIMGISRSATCVIAYLMIKKGMSATEAIRTVRSCRNIHPNIGFMCQIADLDNKLHNQLS